MVRQLIKVRLDGKNNLYITYYTVTKICENGRIVTLCIIWTNVIHKIYGKIRKLVSIVRDLWYT